MLLYCTKLVVTVIEKRREDFITSVFVKTMQQKNEKSLLVLTAGRSVALFAADQSLRDCETLCN